MRPPPGYIEVLLPVWGERYTRDFLDYCLPSLLAPGNLPGLSRLARCTFVLLAPARDAAVIQGSPVWALLLKCCSVRITHIDDLISRSSSTVLTLAYALAIRGSGEQALDTCFVPLVADYVISDGSLLAVVEHIFKGASGVLAGNFQIAREAALSHLEESKSQTGVLAIAPRSLAELSFDALHRTTRAEIVNESQGLKPETNRLFWRVDDHCMVGRFFLMHMIAIRPETSRFIIAGPSDYSLIPELCPSGEVVRMTDSDAYFVVECQPERDVPHQPSVGRIEPRSFARTLGVWATAMHRDNASHAVIFHSGPLPPCLADMVAASAAFVQEVEENSDAPAKPFRNHPLWRRALDYHLTTAQRQQNLARLAEITGDASLAKRRDPASRLRQMLLGRAPHFRPWHPRWPDVQMLKLSLAAAKGKVAFISDASACVRVWLDGEAMGRGGRSIVHFRPADIQGNSSVRAHRSDAGFDSIFLISDQVPAKLMTTLPDLVSLMKPDGLIVLGIGPLFSETEFETELSPALLPSKSAFNAGGLSVEGSACVREGSWRVAVQNAMMRQARSAFRRTDLSSFLRIAVAGGLAAISMFLNIISVRPRSSSQPRVSSLFYTLSLTGPDPPAIDSAPAL
jgi:hypothetical protein